MKIPSIFIRLCMLLPFIMSSSVSFANWQGPYFWQKNKKAYKKVTSERAVIVVVNSEKVTAGEELRMQGIGTLKVDKNFAFKEAKKFESLKEMSEYIKEVKFDKEKMQLYMHSQAYKYHARMLFKVAFQESAKANFIHFEIIKGTFKGMKGRFVFKDQGRRNSEIQFIAQHSYKKLSIPQFFIEFGLEVVIQKMAIRMRELIEKKRAT